MKFILIIVFAITLVNAEANWFPHIFQHFTNTTSAFSSFVSQRGRDIKKYYIDNFRTKFNTIFSNDIFELVQQGQKRPHVRQGVDKRYAKRTPMPTRTTMRTQTYDSQTDNDEETDQDNEVAVQRKPVPITTNEKVQPLSVTTESLCLEDDPIVYMTTPQLIRYYGYNAESHTVLTEDGYFLTLHRIPIRKKTMKKDDPRRTVLLHHGLLGSSADWVIPGPKKGLAFVLADAGYDVWLANVRGNTYSRYHVSRPVDSYAFWNFTFHEVSQYDLPAVIDYIMEVKGYHIKINYIGHSMGTTILFALLSTKTQYNKVLRAGYALAPVAYMTEIRSPLKILARFADNIEYLMKLFGANEFLPQNFVLKWLSKHACEINHYEEAICENSMFVICGHDAKQFNKTLLPLILSHTPAGASTKTLIHYAQIIHNSGRFQQFDYGAKVNMKYYGSPTPPEYPISSITLPIALMSAENDWLTSEFDVTNLYIQLANPIEHYIVPYKYFNHVDFLWAIDAPKLVYAKLLQLLEDGVTTYSYYNPEMGDVGVEHI